MPSHKTLKSVSHNFSHSFISLMNYAVDDYFLGHLLKQARKTKLNRLDIDILRNSAVPSDLLTENILNSINHWNKRFPTFVEDSKSSMDFIKSATMTIEFDLTKERPHRHDNITFYENPFFCEIKIIDDRNKKYVYKHEGWWYPET